MLHSFVDLAKALALALGTFELRPLVLLEELLDLALAILAIVLALVHASFVALVPSTIECFPKAIHHGGAAAARLHRLFEVAGLVAALHDFADDLDNVPVVLAAIADVIAFALADVIAVVDPAVARQSSFPREPLPLRQWRILRTFANVKERNYCITIKLSPTRAFERGAFQMCVSNRLFDSMGRVIAINPIGSIGYLVL